MNKKDATKWARTFTEVALYECIEDGLISKKDIERIKA